MLDYLFSREHFIDIGEQYFNHMNYNLKEWQNFVLFYSDLNNARAAQDEAYKKEKYVGEELDWKMLADNLSLFSSQVEDLKEIRGFDENDNFLLDQSII